MERRFQVWCADCPHSVPFSICLEMSEYVGYFLMTGLQLSLILMKHMLVTCFSHKLSS